MTVWVEEELVEMAEAAVDTASRDPELGDEVSKSMLARNWMRDGISMWSGEVRDALPDEYVEVYEYKARQRDRKKKDYMNKRAAYWRQNVNKQLTKFYDDEAPAPVSRVRESMLEYRRELHDLKDDPEEIEADLAWLDRKIEEYAENVDNAAMVPDQGFDRVSTEPEVGADLKQLETQAAQVVRDIEQLADGDAMDPDAMIDRLAGDYGVGTDAIETLVDTMVRDDVDTRRALRGEHGEDGPDYFREVVDRDAIDGDSGLQELEPAPETASGDGDDDPDDPGSATVVDVEGETVEETEEVEDANDADDVEALPDDAIVRKGGRAEEPPAADGGSESSTDVAEEGEPDVPDGGLSPEDLTTEELIETAVDMVEAGEGEDAIVSELRPDAPSEVAVDMAIEVARERASPQGGAVDPGDGAALTDGGETTEEGDS